MITTRQHETLIKAEHWSTMLRDRVENETMAKQYVEWVDFPNGNEFVRPVVGDLDVNEYYEDEAVKYMPVDSGRFTFQISEYPSSAYYITNAARQDITYARQLEAALPSKMERAVMNSMEAFLMRQGQPESANRPHSQRADDRNEINGFAHRFVASGDGPGAARLLAPEDFAKVNLTMNQINAPQTNRVAFVSPENAYFLETQTNLTNLNDNPQWRGIIETGITSNKRFVRNIYGFDVYTSNFLPKAGVDGSGAVETIDGVSTQENADANIFFSATQGYMPWIGAWRQMPKVDGDYNKDYQREEYVLTARYGAAPQNQENFVTVLSDSLSGSAL